jgi:hypothetical protein
MFTDNPGGSDWTVPDNGENVSHGILRFLKPLLDDYLIKVYLECVLINCIK